MSKYSLINPKMLNDDVLNAARMFKPLVEILNDGRRHYLCNKWIDKLLENKYGGE